MEFPFLLLKLRQKIRSGTEVTAGIARRILSWAGCFLWFKAVPVGEANCIQVVADMFPFNLLFIVQLLCCYDLRAALQVNSHSTFSKRLFPLLSPGCVQELGVSQRHFGSEVGQPFLYMDKAHSSIDHLNSFSMTKGMTFEMEYVSIVILDLTRHC